MGIESNYMIFHLYQFLFKVLHLSRQYHQALSLTCHFPPSQEWWSLELRCELYEPEYSILGLDNLQVIRDAMRSTQISKHSPRNHHIFHVFIGQYFAIPNT